MWALLKQANKAGELDFPLYAALGIRFHIHHGKVCRGVAFGVLAVDEEFVVGAVDDLGLSLHHFNEFHTIMRLFIVLLYNPVANDLHMIIVNHVRDIRKCSGCLGFRFSYCRTVGCGGQDAQ